MKLRAKSPQPRFQRKLVVIAAAVAVLLAAEWYFFGFDWPAYGFSLAPLTITRSTNVNGHQVTMDNIAKNKSTALKLRRDIKALEPVPAGAVYNCPNGPVGETADTLHFLFPKMTVAATESGCNFIIGVDGKSYQTPNDDFWRDLRAAIDHR